MHLDGTHLLGDILARALYQPLAQVGGELRPCVGGDINAAAQRAAHVGGNLPDSVHLHRVGDEYAGLSVRVIDQGTSQYIAKKMRTVKVHLKAGYRVMLYQEKY